MYNVSDFYLDAINKEFTEWRIKVNVKLNKDSETLLVLNGDEDFLSETVKLSSQATSSNTFTIGGVCSSELNISLSSEGIYKLKQLNLLRKYVCFDVNVWILTDDENQNKDDFTFNIDGSENKTGKVHIGYFYIYTVKNSDYKCDLKLYDAMLAFAKDISTKDQINLQQGFRTIYEWLNLFCKSCSDDTFKLGVASGLSLRIANNDETFTIDRDQSMDSYRNAIGYLTVLAGGFAVINRDGLLDIISFNNDNVYHFSHKKIMSYELSEEEYLIDSIKTTVAGFDYDSKTTEYVNENNTITIYLNENKYLRGRQPTDSEELSQIVKDEVDNITSHISGLRFLGGNIEVVGHPELDLGDCISFTKYYLSNVSSTPIEALYENFLICGINWDFQGYSSLKCNEYGDQSSENSSKLSSSFKRSNSGGGGKDGVINSIERLVGLKRITISKYFDQKLFDAYFLVNADIGAQFTVTVTGEVIKEGDIYFRFIYDVEEYFYKPKYYCRLGYKTFSLTCYLDPINIDYQHRLQVYIISNGAIIDVRDYDYQLIVMANGIVGADPSWTGRYDLSDSVQSFDMDNIIVLEGFEDELSHELNDDTSE